MTERRFLVKEGLPPDASGIVDVDGPEHHHLSKVLRLKRGDDVGLFDGRGRGFRGTIETIGRHQSRIRVTGIDDRNVEPKIRVVLAQAIPRHDRMEVVVQKTTELGVSRIIPLVTRRAQELHGKARSAARLERWRRVAREAARQSGRMVVPDVDEPRSWPEFLELSGRISRRIIFDSMEAERASAPVSGAAGTEVIVAVGPEGGWDDQERREARQGGYRFFTLGPRILRTETAGITAVALMLYAAGDLGPQAL